jgi:hypothetical protein
LPSSTAEEGFPLHQKGNGPHRSETPLPYNKVISFLEIEAKVARKFIQICVINSDLGFSYLNQRDVGSVWIKKF